MRRYVPCHVRSGHGDKFVLVQRKGRRSTPSPRAGTMLFNGVVVPSTLSITPRLFAISSVSYSTSAWRRGPSAEESQTSFPNDEGCLRNPSILQPGSGCRYFDHAITSKNFSHIILVTFGSWTGTMVVVIQCSTVQIMSTIIKYVANQGDR